MYFLRYLKRQEQQMRNVDHVRARDSIGVD